MICDLRFAICRLGMVFCVATVSASFLNRCAGSTTIDAANKNAYAANVGWIDGRGDTNNGAVIGEYVCSNYIYSANVGWINLGSGSPTNGIYYQNLSANDFGVNQDGFGNLRGYAWGANIGWINFETNGAPRINLRTGRFSGCAWSANCGWISLSNATAYVQTDTIQQGALAPNGLPIAWLLTTFGTTNVDAGADGDGDGISNTDEYLAGTDPLDANSLLRITWTSHSFLFDSTTLIWNAVPNRYYVVESRPALESGAWAPAVTINFMGADNISFGDANTNQFYRVRAYRPLMP